MNDRVVHVQPGESDEPVFAEPWEARVFSIAVALSRAGHFAWTDFSAALGDELGRNQADLSYYGCWCAALERVLRECGVLGQQEVLARIEASPPGRQDHEHRHGDDILRRMAARRRPPVRIA
jgi:nitrile hydratase accessory protein